MPLQSMTTVRIRCPACKGSLRVCLYLVLLYDLAIAKCYWPNAARIFHSTTLLFKIRFLISSNMSNYHPFELEHGCYQLVAPNIRVLLETAEPQLLFWKSKFASLVDDWGAFYLSPTLMVWADNVTARCRIHPCVVDIGGGELESILLLGPFRNTLHRKQFLGLFDTERQPFYRRSDTVTIGVLPREHCH